MIVEFEEQENDLFQQTVDWLSEKIFSTPDILKKQHSDLQLYFYTKTVTEKSKGELNVTSKEFDLLYFLYSHRGQVFTKEQLYENVWGFENMPLNTSNLPSFIRKLRKKIEPDPDKPIYIIAVWGVDYKFNEEKP